MIKQKVVTENGLSFLLSFHSFLNALIKESECLLPYWIEEAHGKSHYNMYQQMIHLKLKPMLDRNAMTRYYF